MAGIQGKQPEGSYKEAEDIDDMLEEATRLGDIPVVTPKVMVEEANKIAEKIGYVEKEVKHKPRTSWADEVELEKLLGESSRFATRGQGDTALPPPPMLPGAEPIDPNRKPLLESEQREDPESYDYAESFASQKETAQLREEMESMLNRLHAMEEKFDLAMKEREILPMKLDIIKADMNDQLTQILENLQMSRESNAPTSAVTSAMITIGELRTDVADQLQTASSYASGEPKATSPLVSQNANLRGKRRFKPVK